MDTTWFHILTGILENLYKERKTRRVEVNLSILSMETAFLVLWHKPNTVYIIKPQSSIQDI